ncbi:restriction endonuclease subunit S [Legionella quinlivanii]|uniref:restriction endonuclease subunit S n=1 Tax=Legionella quinlivanii TaxID=45073 RepID=UPI002244DF26|nr:hypothetical protein [Legionella quinlivanii]MCW8450623.1 hypothetical protein [Legionella quinlivanii]
MIGKPAIVIGIEEYKTLIASLDVGIVRPNEDMVSRQFLYGLFKTELFQDHTLAHTSGTTVLHLSKNAVSSFEFVCPDKKIMDAFTTITESSANRIQLCIDEMCILTKVRNLLLPRLISGQLRLSKEEIKVLQYE